MRACGVRVNEGATGKTIETPTAAQRDAGWQKDKEGTSTKNKKSARPDRDERNDNRAAR